MIRKKSVFGAHTAGNEGMKGARTVEGEGGAPKVQVEEGEAQAGKGVVAGQMRAITGEGGAVLDAAEAPAGIGA